VTIVTYGWVGWQAMSVAKKVASEHGIETEILDLRTIKPYDRDAIFASAKKTGRVMVLQNDRMYAGYGREIQGDLIENLPGVLVRVVGQRNYPAVGQSRALENATVVMDEDIENAIISMAKSKPAAWLENDLHWLAHAPSRRTT
jgi:2-oxoisovalerate dehydrogenase E1 component